MDSNANFDYIIIETDKNMNYRILNSLNGLKIAGFNVIKSEDLKKESDKQILYSQSLQVFQAAAK